MATRTRSGRRSSSKAAKRIAKLVSVLLPSSPSPRDRGAGERVEPVCCTNAVWFRELRPTGVDREAARSAKAEPKHAARPGRAVETGTWLRHTATRLAADERPDRRTLVERFRDELRSGSTESERETDPFQAAALRVVWSVIALPPEELTPLPAWYSCGAFLGLLAVATPVPNGPDTLRKRLQFCWCHFVGRFAGDDWRPRYERHARSLVSSKYEENEREQMAADEVSEMITKIFDEIIVPPWPWHEARSFLFGVLDKRALRIFRDSGRHVRMDSVSHLMGEDRNAFDEGVQVWKVRHACRVLGSMTEVQRTTIIRYFGDGDTAREIADDRGRAEATIREIVRRGKKIFQQDEILRRYYEEE